MRIKAAIEVVGNASGRVWHANGKRNGAATLVATTDRWSLVSGWATGRLSGAENASNATTKQCCQHVAAAPHLLHVFAS